MENNRGRPRKHPKIESNVQSIGPPPVFSMNQPQIPHRENDEAMVGKPIHCKIEARIEDGFFISVKVENSDSVLRGVVFKPGRCVPVSVNNDVAPHLPMIRRNSDVVHHHDSANGGRNSIVRERHDSGVRSRSRVPVPIQTSQPTHPTIPANHVVPVVPCRSLVPAQPPHPAHPTIPEYCEVPIVLPPVHRQNGGGGIPIQTAHQAIVRNPVVSFKRHAPHLRVQLPVNCAPMHTEMHFSEAQ